MAVLNINRNNFEQEVMNSDKPVLLDFYAAWCGPCKMLSPVIDEIARERSDIKVAKVNVDDHADLAAKYRVYSIPTLMVIKNGQVYNKSMGARPKEQILSMIG